MTQRTALIIWLFCLVTNAVAQILGIKYIPPISAIVALICLLISLITERRSRERPSDSTRRPTSN